RTARRRDSSNAIEQPMTPAPTMRTSTDMAQNPSSPLRCKEGTTVRRSERNGAGRLVRFQVPEPESLFAAEDVGRDVVLAVEQRPHVRRRVDVARREKARQSSE